MQIEMALLSANKIFYLDSSVAIFYLLSIGYWIFT